MKPSNVIEERVDKVLERMAIVIDAADKYGTALNLPFSAESLRAELAAYAGSESGEGPLVIGKLIEANRAAEQLDQARVVRDQAERVAQKCCADAKNLVKCFLGNQWSAAWAGAGFTAKSLASNGDPVKLLSELRGTFRSHPEWENEALGLTAARVQEVLDQLSSARAGVRHALSAVKAANEARDAALLLIRKRLMGLKWDLKSRLGLADPRWNEFGFRCPIDYRVPVAVEGLLLMPGLPGQVLAKWEASRRAKSYRVSYKTAGSEELATVGLISTTEKLLTGLLTGTKLVVQVSAVNPAGETAVTEAEIVVP